MKLPITRVPKAVIYASMDDNEEVQEVAILIMHGPYVRAFNLVGPNVDTSNIQGILQDIITEETDSRFFNSDVTVSVTIQNAQGDENIAAEIADIITDYLKMEDDEIQYVLYNDNAEGYSNFYETLREYLEDHNDDLTPTHFRDVFITESDINQILIKYEIEDHMYTKDASMSSALYSGIVFDLTVSRI
jgi:hypothetical protein